MKMMANTRVMAKKGEFIGVSQTRAAKVPYLKATKSLGRRSTKIFW
jgi:hypothetical protein